MAEGELPLTPHSARRRLGRPAWAHILGSSRADGAHRAPVRNRDQAGMRAQQCAPCLEGSGTHLGEGPFGEDHQQRRLPAAAVAHQDHLDGPHAWRRLLTRSLGRLHRGAGRGAERAAASSRDAAKAGCGAGPAGQECGRGGAAGGSARRAGGGQGAGGRPLNSGERPQPDPSSWGGQRVAAGLGPFPSRPVQPLKNHFLSTYCVRAPRPQKRGPRLGLRSSGGHSGLMGRRQVAGQRQCE